MAWTLQSTYTHETANNSSWTALMNWFFNELDTLPQFTLNAYVDNGTTNQNWWVTETRQCITGEIDVDRWGLEWEQSQQDWQPFEWNDESCVAGDTSFAGHTVFLFDSTYNNAYSNTFVGDWKFYVSSGGGVMVIAPYGASNRVMWFWPEYNGWIKGADVQKRRNPHPVPMPDSNARWLWRYEDKNACSSSYAQKGCYWHSALCPTGYSDRLLITDFVGFASTSNISYGSSSCIIDRPLLWWISQNDNYRIKFCDDYQLITGNNLGHVKIDDVWWLDLMVGQTYGVLVKAGESILELPNPE